MRIKNLKYIAIIFLANKALAESVEVPNPLQAKDFYELLNSIADALIYLSAPVAVGAIIYAGYIYMSSAGEENEIERAKKILTWTIVGFGIILMSKGLILAIKDLFGVK